MINSIPKLIVRGLIAVAIIAVPAHFAGAEEASGWSSMEWFDLAAAGGDNPVPGNPADDSPWLLKDWYFRVFTAAARTDFDVSGFNSAGAFPNTGDFSDDECIFGLEFGRSFFDQLRVGVEWTKGRDISKFTPSFPGPPGPITFWYRTEVEIKDTMMLNVWWDIPTGCRFRPFVGAGVGLSQVNVDTRDSVVWGDRCETRGAFQMMAGGSFELADGFFLESGWRYVYFGSHRIPLDPGAAGTYNIDLDSHEWFFGLRCQL